jgi:hypothetical protein
VKRPDRTKRRSKREQIAQRTRAAEEAPPVVVPPLPEPKEPDMPPSPLAEWLLDPGAATRKRVQIAASLGRLTKADLQSALTAQMIVEAEHMARDPEGFEEQRKGYVMRQRLLRSLLDVVKQSQTSGPLQSIRVVWPAHYKQADAGDDVRLEAADGE